jgi:uncharacterized membrane protein YjgN (DUF898 family)
MTDATLPPPTSAPTFGKLGTPREPEQLNFSYVPRPGLFRLTIMNLFLNIITLTFYRFWAKTNVRQHIWSCIHVNGEPLEYTGTGKEKFKGFLMVFGCVFLPYIVATSILTVYLGPQSPILSLIQGAFILFIYIFWGFAVYRARKYQLSRTNWRGIRGALVGSAMIYSLLYFGNLLAKGMSMGWATPVMNTVLQEQITNDMRFGDAAFKFKGRAGPLYPTYALCWFLTFGAFIAAIAIAAGSAAAMSNLKDMFGNLESPENAKAIGIAIFAAFVLYLVLALLIIPMLWSIYIAKEMRTFATYTRFDGAPFTLNATAWSVIRLTVVNLLLLVFTLGIAWPFINQRLVRFMAERLTLEGKVDIDRIRQSQAAMLTRGEGLADAFDVGGL